jgi:hypothetical protein
MLEFVAIGGIRGLIEEVPIDVDAGGEAIRVLGVSMQIVGGELARDLCPPQALRRKISRHESPASRLPTPIT